MRASTGLGLIAIISLFACTATGVAETMTPTPEGAAGENGSSTDPTTPEGSADPTDPEKAPSPLVSNLAVTDVAIFQAVQVNVVKGGAYVAAKKRNAPVVARRPGLIRVYVEPGDGWKAREVTAEVRLVADDEKFPILRETKKISGASKDDDPKSTFNLEVPAENLPPGVTFQVVLTAADGEQVKDGREEPGSLPSRWDVPGSRRRALRQAQGRHRPGAVRHRRLGPHARRRANAARALQEDAHAALPDVRGRGHDARAVSVDDGDSRATAAASRRCSARCTSSARRTRSPTTSTTTASSLRRRR